MHARRVDEHDLTFRFGDDALDFKAGGLRFVGNGCNFLADELI